MFIIFAMPRTNEGDNLHRSLKNCCGVEPQQFLAKNFTQAHNYPKRKWQHRHTFLNSTSITDTSIKNGQGVVSALKIIANLQTD